MLAKILKADTTAQSSPKSIPKGIRLQFALGMTQAFESSCVEAKYRLGGRSLLQERVKAVSVAQVESALAGFVFNGAPRFPLRYRV